MGGRINSRRGRGVRKSLGTQGETEEGGGRGRDWKMKRKTKICESFGNFYGFVSIQGILHVLNKVEKIPKKKVDKKKF